MPFGGIFDALAALATAFSKALDYLTGGLSRDQRRLREELDDHAEGYRQALHAGDVGAANHHLAELERLHDKATAIRAGRR